MFSFLLRRQDIAKEHLLDLLGLDFWDTFNGSYMKKLGLSESSGRTFFQN
jgi:hypothetical protein